MPTKYIEELNNGDSFEFENTVYVLSSDFKKNGDRMAVSTQTGQTRWVNASSMVETCELYTMDKENNIITIKPSEKEDVTIKDPSLS